MAIVTLLTDFGLQDEYAGVLKGVILGIHPDAKIIDITHNIQPQDVKAAAYTLKSVFHFFPQKTIHVAVVDPGVGSQRRIIAAACAGHFFLAPDNGLLCPILAENRADHVHCVENPRLFKHPVSRTFHGRDVFAPVAAHLALGFPLKDVGRPIGPKNLQPLTVRYPKIRNSGVLEGEVIKVDRFGNLITNIGQAELSEWKTAKFVVVIGKHSIEKVVDYYAQGLPGEACVIIGSRDCLEIFVNCGDAANSLNSGPGDLVQVKVNVNSDVA